MKQGQSIPGFKGGDSTYKHKVISTTIFFILPKRYNPMRFLFVLVRVLVIVIEFFTIAAL
jgi:hypothetical protein